ncbi:MAG: SDR family oxidoreductase [bacterium]|nr:SDR family oxidoreductase [bacterium]
MGRGSEMRAEVPRPARHVVVTGASGGLGQACAVAFAAPGVCVGVHYGRNLAGARETARRVEDRGATAYLVEADFRVADAWRAVVDAIGEQSYPLDVLLLNAGLSLPKRIVNMSEEDWDTVLQVNYRSHVALLEACAVNLLRAGSHVLAVASLVGLRGEIGLSAYAASKGALIGLVQDAARRLGPRGICVNAILPGLLRTGITANMSDEQFAAAVGENALGHGSTCEEVARVAVFIATLQNVSGQVFALDSRLRL